MSDASKPGPKRVSEIREAVQNAGVVCVFSEPQLSSSLVRKVFEGSNARTAMLDPQGIE